MAGRPSKYDSEYHPKKGYKLSLLGYTDQDLANFFEVNVDSIYEWKKKHEDFSDALKRGKTEADAKVVHSLYRRALGYTVTESEQVMYKGGMHTLETKRKILPDVTAQIFWLKNRQPEKWRDKQEVKHSIDSEQVFKIGDTVIKF